jgi:hypothetical protein
MSLSRNPIDTTLLCEFPVDSDRVYGEQFAEEAIRIDAVIQERMDGCSFRVMSLEASRDIPLRGIHS